MNILDLVLGGALLYGIFTGYRRGVFRQIAGIIGLYLALVFGLKYSYVVGDLLQESGIAQEKTAPFISFCIAFILILIGIHFLAGFLRKLSRGIGLGLLENLLGAVLGGVKISLFVGAFLFFMLRVNGKTHFLPEETLSESILLPYFKIGFPIIESFWHSLVKP
ncbi:CvpA family protein [Ornithobacterium rhinotracheale]|uniref:CvpA family protein n=1 Tax=Ornithobacterium rhinotracheale TaxID=28251 RepID=UPI00129C9A2B|nr:CvpA family protein [Ornithobacterium rhinotracheale]MRI62829.1 CvpA family protein [Ornithobacterium rhinotracheale]MRJ09887.1 CvpA family protein [Ornithobacterium rhinotracheale]